MYVLMNPVAAGISATCAEYPGLSSLEANVGVRAACGAVDVPVELPPQWAGLDDAELSRQRAWMRDELRARENAVKEDRRKRGLPRPKAERCLRVDPFDRPMRPARRPAPMCFAATLDARRAFARLRRTFVAAYRWASAQFRAGVLDVMFPAGAFPRGCRVLPWSPAPEPERAVDAARVAGGRRPSAGGSRVRMARRHAGGRHSRSCGPKRVGARLRGRICSRWGA